MSDTTLAEVYWDNKRHEIYLARMPCVVPTGDPLIRVSQVHVKYNEATHRLFTNRDPPLAPTPYHCVHVICGLHIEVPIADGSADPCGARLEEFSAYLIVEIKNELGLGEIRFYRV